MRKLQRYVSQHCQPLYLVGVHVEFRVLGLKYWWCTALSTLKKVKKTLWERSLNDAAALLPCFISLPFWCWSMAICIVPPQPVIASRVTGLFIVSWKTDMCEIRFEMDDHDMAVIDAFCSATGRCRTEVVREILGAWAEKKIHESMLVMRVAGRNPVRSESHSGATGRWPEYDRSSSN